MTFHLNVKFDLLFEEKRDFFNLKKGGGRYPAAVSGRNFRKLIIMSVSIKFLVETLEIRFMMSATEK